MHGLLVIDKPKNWTSRDVVNLVSKCLHTKKVGHSGTLDPLATGVLVLCVGDYTKLVNHITNHQKEYIATIQFGILTDTLDITGTVLAHNQIFPLKEDILLVLPQFLGVQMQEVPLYSAKKVAGKRLYEYARNQENVSLPMQQIEIKELELLEYHTNEVTLRCVVSKGTYIRSLIRDICNQLGVLGVMKDLVRFRQGNFLLTEAISIDNVKENHFCLQDFHSFLEYEAYEVTKEELNVIYHRNELYLPFDSTYVLLLHQNREIALYQKHLDRYKPLLVFDNF
ncbi:MAG: tRNA pseudouridine(55) synthase TruB [Bacilli bacterium]|jgi:tRNA pseudouridine55 synthase|nr:tRNA pseudouridine(55) synthase TruB [Bacilli bacterium]